jgi:hypothetical protein
MDGEDRGLGVVRAGEHDLQDRTRRARGAGAAPSAISASRLPSSPAPGPAREDARSEACGPARRPADGRASSAARDQLLGAAVVVPERRRRHLGVEPRGASPCRGGQRCLRSSSTRRASSATSRFTREHGLRGGPTDAADAPARATPPSRPAA